jgi:hypothetical protein
VDSSVTDFLPTFEEESGALLSWDNVFGWEGLVCLLLGLPVTIAAARRPRWVWPMLIMVNIVGIGPRVKGYFILDEIFTGLIILGCLMVIVLRGRLPKASDGDAAEAFEKERQWMFYLWTAYVVWQSVRGMLNQDVRMIRWVVMYVMLAVLSRIVSRRAEFPFPSLRGVALIVLNTTILFYLFYLGQGLYWESVLPKSGLYGELGRFQSQHFFWAGSAFAVFPTLIAMPAALILLNDKSLRTRGLAWSGIILMMIIAFYYDSQTSWIVIGAYVIVSLYRFKIWHALIVGLCFIMLFFTFVEKPTEHLGEFLLHFFTDASALVGGGEADDLAIGSRNLQLKAAIRAATDNPGILLFGAGYYEHRYILGPYVKQLYEESLPSLGYNVVSGSRNDPFAFTVFRTMAFPALLVDTGLLGVTLFAMNFVLAGIGVMKWGGGNRYILVLALFMGFMWLLVSNILDIVLLHLMLMPGGLIYQIGWAGRKAMRGEIGKRQELDGQGAFRGAMTGRVVRAEALQ